MPGKVFGTDDYSFRVYLINIIHRLKGMSIPDKLTSQRFQGIMEKGIHLIGTNNYE
jgi:hypothetical protein